jgi:DNA-binding transcriptional MerR regulator
MNTHEAANALGCSTDILRKYERNFNLKIQRNGENYRVYKEKDMETFKNILQLKERGLSLNQIKDILDRTVEVQDQKIAVLKNSSFDKFQGKDFEIIVQNVINSSLEGTVKQIGALQGEVSTGFSGIARRMDAMLKQQHIMLKRQDEIIEERDHKVIELDEEIKRLKSLKWYQRKK